MSEREVCDVFEDFFKVECEAAQNLTYKQNEDLSLFLAIALFTLKLRQNYGKISERRILLRIRLDGIVRLRVPNDLKSCRKNAVISTATDGFLQHFTTYNKKIRKSHKLLRISV